MSVEHIGDNSFVDQFTRRAVRSFWDDGLWDLASAGIFLLLGGWGAVYVRFIAFPPYTRPFLEEIGRQQIAWVGLALLVVALTLYVTIAWYAVKVFKRLLVYPRTGLAKHRFFMPIDRKVYLWYFILYLVGLGLLYGLFKLVKGGFSVLSVSTIISPAAINIVVGKMYHLKRYQWIAVIGLILAVFLELFITTPADYMVGPRNFLDVLPQWGSIALPSYIWGGMFTISGLIGLIGVLRDGTDDE